MQAVEADRQRPLDAADNSGLDLIELDLEVRDAGGHAAKLRSSLRRGQCHGNNSSRREAG